MDLVMCDIAFGAHMDIAYKAEPGSGSGPAVGGRDGVAKHTDQTRKASK